MSTPSDKAHQDRPNRKRQRDVSAFEHAYANFTFTPIESSGRPGTPHRYFQESYRVKQATENQSDGGQETDTAGNRQATPTQIVHKHANGLVIITAGDMLPDASTVQKVEFLQQQGPVANQSAGAKRKQQAKMLRGKDVPGTVQPTDTLARIELANGSPLEMKSCVWGSVLEINTKLASCELIEKDPLLDGYLAVILPSGPFPPRGKGEAE